MIKNNKEKVFELKIQEDDEVSGIDSISLVDEPAIEINWVAFKKEKEHEFHIPDGEDEIYLNKLMSVSQDEQELFDDGWVVSKMTILGQDEFYSTDPNAPSEEDEKEYNVRYKYVLNPRITGQSAVIATTRDFCKTLINQNRVWRLEDMDAVSNDFGDSALVWRGGFNCRHVWARMEYRKDATIINKASVNKGKIDPQAPIDPRVLGIEEPSTVTSRTLGNPSPSTIKNLGLAKEKFADKPKVSLDYDGVLSTDKGKELYKELVDAGNDVYIVTARNEKEGREVLDVAKTLRIPQSKVLFTSGGNKSEVLNRIGITKHYDNNPDVIAEIKKNAPSVEAIKFKIQQMESHSDYPDSVKNNAKAVLKYVDENGWGSCGTSVGKIRASQLAKGEPISEETIKRMYSYLSRHKVDLDSSKGYGDGCGKLMYDSWGGLSALSWAESKVNSFSKKEFQECPPATQDVATNLKNRQEAIKVAHYGPLNPNEPNEDYWKAKAKMFNGDVESAKKARCGNCSFFVQTKNMLDCIAGGINDKNEWDTIDAGDLGYCEAFDFKCAASRTCDAWVVGGPITDENMGYDVGAIGGYVDPAIKKKPIAKAINANFDFINQFEYLFANDMVKCENCGWQWNLKDGGNDPYVCHKCGYDNSSQKQNMSNQRFATDTEKHIVLGPAMIPEQKIFRKDALGNPYYVFFSPETIKMIAEKYMKNKYTDNNDLMHDGTAVKDIHVLESWIKESNNDKSSDFGYGDLPVGTWFVSMKVNNPDVWKQIKEGKLNGFSVSGYFEEVAAFSKEEMFLYKVAEVIKNIKE
jgi:hypothetical protein